MARVLLSDDDEPLRKVVSTMLERGGHAVTAAASLAECRQELARGLPDLLITDLLSREGDEVGALAEIRRAYPGLKILAISGAFAGAGGNLLDLAVQAGADATLAKPFRSVELLAAVNALLGG